MTTKPDSSTATDTTTPHQRVPAESDSAHRGQLRIERAVLRRIAEHAADLACDRVRPRRRRPGSTGHGGPRARLSGPDYALHVRITTALRYPDAATDRVRAVRERVTAELSRHAEVSVHRVDVTVTALVPAETAPRVR